MNIIPCVATIAAIVLLCAFCPLGVTASLPTDPTYRVVSMQYAPQYVPHWVPNAQEQTLAMNKKSITSHIANASALGGDIVVFPEGATGYFQANLNGTRSFMSKFCEVLPNVEHGLPVVIPCVDTRFKADSQLKTFSCAASHNSIYTVVNMCDMQPCSPENDSSCPADGMNLYDTQAVFSPTGQLIAKYWKYNLFSGDHLLNRLPTPQHTTFTTSFGVTFGTFVCFDLTYRDPAVALVDEGITDFVFSTYWINGHVFTATAIQQAFSRAQNVNLIASNVGVCTSNCGGGVYHQGEAVATFWQPSFDLNTVAIVADVPKIKAKQRVLPTPSGLRGAGRAHASAAAGTTVSAVSTAGNQTDCGFGPASCNSFDTSKLSAGTISATSNLFPVTCTLTFSVQTPPPQSEMWALQANVYAHAVPDSPSYVNLTSCVLLRCEIRVDSRGHHYCHVPQDYSSAGTTFGAATLSATGLAQGVELFPEITIKQAEVLAPADAVTFTHDSGAGNATMSIASPQTIFQMSLMGYNSPLSIALEH